MSNEIERRHVSLECRMKNIEETLNELKELLLVDNVVGDAAELRESILTALENSEYRMRRDE